MIKKFLKDSTFIISILALIGIALSLYCTKWGIGLSADSVTYITGARNLLNNLGVSEISGTGEVKPITVFPPLFPMVLALIGLFGIDPLIGARILNALLFGANIILVGFIIRKCTRSFWAPLIGSSLILTNGNLLGIHSMAWTEPLFLFLGLLGLILMAKYIDDQKPIFLIVSAIIISLAFLDRYAGGTLAVTGIVGILFLTKKTPIKKFTDSLIFTILGCFPIGLWILRNLYLSGNATTKKLGFYPLSSFHIKYALDTTLSWLLPLRFPMMIKTIFLLGVVGYLCALGIRYAKKKTAQKLIPSESTKILSVLTIFILLYLGLLAIAIVFIDAKILPTYRILSPAYISGLILIICLVDKFLYSAKETSIFKMVSILLVLIITGAYLFHEIKLATYIHDNGIGYSSKFWRQSEIIQKVKALPPGTLIYTNGTDAIYILAGKPATKLPAKVHPGPREINENYLSEITKMKQELKENNGVVVYLYSITWRWYLPTEEELKKLLPLHLVTKCKDGAIYKIAD